MWTWLGIALAGTCATDGLDAGAKALAEVDAKHHVALAAAAIAEACKLPAGLKAGLPQLAQVPADRMPLLDARLVVDDVSLWTRACPGGPGALAEAMKRAPAEARDHLYTACTVNDAWIDRDTWKQASGLRVAPILLGSWLTDQGVAAETVRVYVRALAGVSDRPVDNKVDTFQPLF